MADVGYVTSFELTQVADAVPANLGRQSLIMDLIEAYDLPLTPITVTPATKAQLTQFHSNALITRLLRRRKPIDDAATTTKTTEWSDFDSEPSLSDSELDSDDEILTLDTSVGLAFDCPPFPHMRRYVQYLIGSALAAADAVKHQNLVLNWYGGRHHATKSRAAGFCYVNDICYTIQRLRRLGFQRVFYLDFDLHHGDGVETSYRGSAKVFTCSIHRYDVGFFPGTGGLADNVANQANIPLKAGLSDTSLLRIVKDIILPLLHDFNPDCLIIQTGCDGLGSDPAGQWNLTIPGLSRAIMEVYRAASIPTIMVGGGGYHHRDAARFWCYLTHIASEQAPPSPDDYIRDHPGLDRFEEDHYQFWTDNNCQPRRTRDENTEEYLKLVADAVFGDG